MEIVDWEQGRKTELFKGSRERATPFLIPPPPTWEAHIHVALF